MMNNISFYNNHVARLYLRALRLMLAMVRRNTLFMNIMSHNILISRVTFRREFPFCNQSAMISRNSIFATTTWSIEL